MLSQARMPLLRVLTLHDQNADYNTQVPIPATPQLEAFHTALLFDCEPQDAIRELSSWKALKKFGFTLPAMMGMGLRLICCYD